MARRSSVNFVPKPAPYQIYHTNNETGKTVAGSKRKLCWRFGWTDSEIEHSVDLKHSLLSGKRTIYEDGREVNQSQGIFSSEFSHGWESNKHIFRVEANTGIGSEPIYIFTIDGVRFEDFQRKPTSFDIPKEVDEPPVQVNKTPVTQTAQPPKSKTNIFPSVESTSSSFDPFADKSESLNKPNTNSNSNAKAASFDPFSSSSDPFTSNSAPPKTKQPEIDFFSTPTTVAPSTQNDFFSAPPSTNNNSNKPVDLFSSTPSSSSNTLAFNDFSGLTYVPPPPQPMQAQKQVNPTPTPVMNEVDNTPNTSNSTGDVWGGLVDLNLGSKDKPVRRASIQTGPSLNQMSNVTPNAAPVMQTQSNVGANPFGVTHMGGVVGFGNAPQPNAYAPPPTQTGSYDPFSNVGATSTLAYTPTPIGPGYGGGMPQSGYGMNTMSAGYNPGNPKDAISNMGNPFGPGPSLGGGQPRPTGYGGYTQQGPPKQQNSLDSLNWKM